MKLAIVQYSSNFGGSTLSGKMIASGMLGRGWDVQVYFGFNGPFVDTMQDENCSTHIVPHKNWLRRGGIFHFLRNFIAEHRASMAFEREFRRTKPSIVYVNTLVSYAAASAANRLNIPVVWHIREMFSDEHGEMAWPARFAKGFVRRRILKLATKIVVNSSAVAMNVFGPNHKFVVENIPNAITPKFFVARSDKSRCRKNLGLPNGVPLIGLPGTLRKVKGHEFFFNTIPLILARIPECHFVVTGAVDSGFARSLLEIAEAQPLAGRVIFTGAIDDMLSFYHACDACCVPSLSEPFGRTAIECFATYTPLVATAVGGLKEIVTNNVNALLVPFGQESALADALVSILVDSDRADKLVERAASDAATHYTEPAYVKRVANVIDQATSLYQNKF